jgi:hypothetical protein
MRTLFKKEIVYVVMLCMIITLCMPVNSKAQDASATIIPEGYI